MNQKRVPIVPQGRIGRVGDAILQPVMYWLQGNWSEVPQRTHVWNNQKFSASELGWLDSSKMVLEPCNSLAGQRYKWRIVPIFHMPRFGGWKRYVVLQLVDPTVKWHVGWVTSDVCGVSQIILSSPVRVLQGRTECRYFGIDQQGNQIPIEKIGTGTIGGSKQWGQMPLL